MNKKPWSRRSRQFIAGVAALTAYSALTEIGETEPHHENITTLEIPHKDQNRLLYLQATIREIYSGPDYQSFSNWKELHHFPEYHDLTPNQILIERDEILSRNGYSTGTLKWEFKGKNNTFHESFNPRKLETPKLQEDVQNKVDIVLKQHHHGHAQTHSARSNHQK